MLRTYTQGQFTSPPGTAPAQFSTVVMSVNMAGCRRASLGLVAAVSVRRDAEWSPWFRLLRWGHAVIDDGVLDAPQGHVDVDELHLAEPASEIRCRVNWQSTDRACTLRRVALCLALPAPWTTSAYAPKPVRLEVPFLSQWAAREHEGNRVCSPTCLAMVARFHGESVSLDEVASLAYDSAFDVYGNWSTSMLAMSLLGFRATVERAGSLESLDRALDTGLPLVTSIAFGPGELKGAPIEQTRGHLVVVCGRTDHGEVLARDPAARGTDDLRSYDRSQFERAWLGHGGVYYKILREATA